MYVITIAYSVFTIVCKCNYSVITITLCFLYVVVCHFNIYAIVTPQEVVCGLQLLYVRFAR